MKLGELLSVSTLWNGNGKSFVIVSDDGYMMYDSNGCIGCFVGTSVPKELLDYEVTMLSSESADRYRINIKVTSDEIMYSPEEGFVKVADLMEDYCDYLKEGHISRDTSFNDWVPDRAVHLIRLSEEE